jgi:mRNA interferase RelE/StbE
MYRVFLERAAERQLKQLSAKLPNRVIAAIQSLGSDPRPTGCRKLAGDDNDWRIRTGEYRVVYEIDDAKKEILVNRVRHRREVYR